MFLGEYSGALETVGATLIGLIQYPGQIHELIIFLVVAITADFAALLANLQNNFFASFAILGILSGK